MKFQKDDKSNKTRHFCRYIPKLNSDDKDESLVNDKGNPSFGPELTMNLQGNIFGELYDFFYIEVYSIWH